MRERLGGAAFGFMVNEVQFMSNYPIQLGSRPRLAFQTFLPREFAGFGCAEIDTYNFSVESLREPAAS
ncbi:MAG: hypothetical protein WCC69_04065 [Pirellulales bacterium]